MINFFSKFLIRHKVLKSLIFSGLDRLQIKSLKTLGSLSLDYQYLDLVSDQVIAIRIEQI